MVNGRDKQQASRKKMRAAESALSYFFSYFCSGFQSSKPPLVPAADNEVKLLSENFFMLQKYNYTLIRTQNKVHRFHDWGVCVQI